MTLEQLKNIIADLAKSQGFYGRLQRDMDENDRWDELLKVWNDNNMQDAVDLVYFLNNNIMTKEQIYEASEEWSEARGKPYISANALYKGLAIFAKYTENMSIGVGHEEIWVGFDDEDDYEKLTQEDLEVLFTHGLNWDSGNECFHKFL